MTMLSRFKTLLDYAAKATTQTPAVMQEFSAAQPIVISNSNVSSAPPSVPPASSADLETAIKRAKHVKSHCR